MINRKFFGILIVLLVILGAMQLLQRNSHEEQTSRSNQRVIVEDTFSADDLSRVVIGYGDAPEALDLRHNPDGWVVENVFGHRVKSGKIDALLTAVSGLSGEFRSDNESVIGDYSLNEDEAIRIALFLGGQSEPACELLVGAQPTGSRGNFVRRPGSHEVCLTDASVLNPLGLYSGPDMPKTTQFLDLQAVQLNGADVDAIVLTDGETVTTLEKEFAVVETESPEGAAPEATPPVDRTAYDWRITTPTSVAALKTKVDAIQNAAGRINAVDVADPAADRADYGLSDPARSASLALSDGTETILLFGADRPESEGVQAGVYMQVAGDPTIWVVTNYTVDNIFKDHTELLPEE